MKDFVAGVMEIGGWFEALEVGFRVLSVILEVGKIFVIGLFCQFYL